MLDYLIKLTKALEMLRNRRRLEYHRAVGARPDYGRRPPLVQWPLVVDGMLSNGVVLMRVLSFVGGALVLVPLIFCVVLLYLLVRGFF